MFGQNPIRHKERLVDGKLQVREIFQTLQGEAMFAGWPAVFIRFTGCNLKCAFCDTQWDDDHDPYMTADEIVAAVAAVRLPTCNLIIITGGEPLRQDMSILVPALLALNLKIQFETAGTLWQDVLLHPGVSIVVSPKTPKIDEQIWIHATAFKYVIKSGENDDIDGLPLQSTQLPGQPARLARPRPGAPVYLSPCDEQDQRRNDLNKDEVVRLAMKHGYIAGLQLHKIWNVR